MDRERERDRHLLIKGNFRPNRGLRIFRVLMLFFGAILGTGFVTALLLYGFVVHTESEMNAVGRQTRQLHEENKTLQVSLQRLQSYQNVEAAAEKVPQLKSAEEIIEVDVRYNLKPLPLPPERHVRLPRVYGY